MKTAFSFNRFLPLFFAVALAQAPSIVHAQADCAGAQPGFVSAMEAFRTAYFEREGAQGTAESVMEEQVLPAAEQMYQSCPSNIVSAIKAGVMQSQASLKDSNRAQLVACDKALVSYNKMLSSFDNLTIAGGYDAYRNLLYKDIDPAAKAAVDACPQIPDLASETRIVIAERQTRLDRMEDMDNFGSSMADNIAADNAYFSDTFEDDDE